MDSISDLSSMVNEMVNSGLSQEAISKLSGVSQPTISRVKTASVENILSSHAEKIKKTYAIFKFSTQQKTPSEI